MSQTNFIFMGSPSFAATVLQGLLEAGWVPALVVTEPPKPVGRKQVLTPTAVQSLAEARGLSVATPDSKQELLEMLLASTNVADTKNPPRSPFAKGEDTPLFRKEGLGEILGHPSAGGVKGQRSKVSNLDLIVVAAYGRILTQVMLDLPRLGAVNVHASLLPKYRGASPIQAALLAGDTQTGVTFMKMEVGLDSGPILTTMPVTIEARDTVLTLTEKLAQTGAKALPQVLEQYVNGHLQPLSQPATGVSVASKLTKEDGTVELVTIDSMRLDRMVRALTPWPGVVSFEFGTPLKILEGHLIDSGAYCITHLQWAGKPAVDGATFARANPDVLTKWAPGIKLDRDK